MDAVSDAFAARLPGRSAPSLDQLRVFLAVAEVGSFAGAARGLGRATSAITYQIGNLERQLGLSMFDRDGTRRPRLTAAGRAVAVEAHAVTRGVDRLVAKARGMAGGLEAEVSLGVDILLPTSRLTDAARAFKAAFPTVPLRLHLEGPGAATRLILEGIATLGICGAHLATDPRLERIAAGGVELVPVAAPTHPLAETAIIRPGDAADHIQLVRSDRSDLTEGRDLGVLARETWRMGDLSSKHALLLSGMGWGAMPRPIVAEDLSAGRLVALTVPEWPRTAYAFVLAHRTDRPPGPAGLWLIDHFLGQARPASASVKERWRG